MLKGKLSDRTTQVRFFRFLVVGGVAAICQFSILHAARESFGPKAAFSLSFGCSTIVHYSLNRFWALRSSRQDIRKQFGEYLLAVIASYVINLVAFSFCHDWLGLTVMWAAALAIPPSTLAVFLLLNFRVFKASGQTRQDHF